MVTISGPVSPGAGATAQPEELGLGGGVDPFGRGLHSKQGTPTGVVLPSRMRTCLVQVVATHVPGTWSNGPSVTARQGCPAAVHGGSDRCSGTTSARARVAPMASGATTAATATRWRKRNAWRINRFYRMRRASTKPAATDAPFAASETSAARRTRSEGQTSL